MSEYVLRTWIAIQFNGSNMAEILAAAGAVPACSRDMAKGIFPWPINPTDWVVIRGNTGRVMRRTNAQFHAGFREGSEVASDIADEVLATPQVQQALRDYGAFGIAVVPSLLGQAQTTVQVTIRPTLPDTTYTPVAILSGAVGLLASLSVLSATPVATNGPLVSGGPNVPGSSARVDVVVRNTGLLTLSGGSVFVHCA